MNDTLDAYDKLDIHLIQQALRSNRFGHPIHYFQSIDSTQTVAKRMIRNRAQEGTLIVAEEQSAGKGRLGKSWHSPAGKGLWLSLIVQPNIPQRMFPQMTLLASVAVCLTIREMTGLHALIKWPNDILINDRKVSGVLLESVPSVSPSIVAGIGISVNLQREDFPEYLHHISTSLRIECGKPVDREQLLIMLMQQFEQCVRQYETYGFAPIRSLWTTLSTSLHRPITIRKEDGAIVTGVATRLDTDGALLLQTGDGRTERFVSGVQQ